MLKLGRVTKVKVLFLVLVYVFNFDLFEFGEGSIVSNMASALWTANEMVDLSTPIVSPTACSKPPLA